MPAVSRPWIEPFVLAAAGLAFLALFWPTFGWMADRFSAPDSFYSHGWLVPVASGWLAWQRREQLAAISSAPSSAGLLLLVPAVMLHLAGVWSRMHVLSGFMFVVSAWAMVWMLWGAEAVRALRVPLAFLLFMVPLPGVLVIGASFTLKLAAASLAASALQLAGIPATQEGSLIRLPQFTMLVDDTCSGLRSLLSLVALSTLWAAMLPERTPLWKRAILTLASVPISLAANMARILLLTMLALVWGRAAAEGFLHGGSGIVVFGVAVAALGAISWVLTARERS
jgi:exosortase